MKIYEGKNDFPTSLTGLACWPVPLKVLGFKVKGKDEGFTSCDFSGHELALMD